MAGADSFEVFHQVGIFLDLFVLDRQGFFRPGDRSIQVTVVEVGRTQILVT